MEKKDRMELFYHVYPDKRIIKALDEMHYFEAPASTKYHGSYEGGLFDHSYQMAICLNSLTVRLCLEWENKFSPAKIGLFHDLCKCDCYVKNEDGTFSYNDKLALNGHGDKSVILAQSLSKDLLTMEEILCIRWHMGAFDDKSNWNCYTQAIKECSNVLWTHTADMMATHIMQV